jgi:hypothetical protein
MLLKPQKASCREKKTPRRLQPWPITSFSRTSVTPYPDPISLISRNSWASRRWCLTCAWGRQESLVCQEFGKSFFALLAIQFGLEEVRKTHYHHIDIRYTNFRGLDLTPMPWPAEPHYLSYLPVIPRPLDRYVVVRFGQTDDAHFCDIKPPLGISTLGSRRLGDCWGSRV